MAQTVKINAQSFGEAHLELEVAHIWLRDQRKACVATCEGLLGEWKGRASEPALLRAQALAEAFDHAIEGLGRLKENLQEVQRTFETEDAAMAVEIDQREE